MAGVWLLGKPAYSTWDIVGAVYWPQYQITTLKAWTEAIPGTAEARRARGAAKAWRRMGRWGRHGPRLVGALALCAIVLCAFAAGAWIAAGSLRAPGAAGRSAISWAFRGLLGVTVVAILANTVVQRSVLGGRAMVVRRLREEGFGRRIRTGFAEGRRRPLPAPEELKFRRAYWRKELDQAPSSRQIRPYLASRPLAPFIVAGVYVCWLAAVAIPPLRTIGGNDLFYMIWGGAIASGVTYARSSSGLRRRARSSLNDGLCPDCGYDLSGVPVVTVGQGDEGVSIGPERCTECGVPFPLLAPAVPRLAR